MAGARRGPMPEPTAVTKAKGNPGKKKMADREPAPRAGKPAEMRCPAWLGWKAKRLWRLLRPELDRLGLLTAVDAPMLEAACRHYENWRDAEKAIQQCGISVKAPSGYEQVNPAVAFARQEFQAFRQCVQEFGLSPASRARLGTTEREAVDALSEFLKGVAAAKEDRVKGRPDLRVVGGKKK